MRKIGFIGVGNMGGALALAVSKAIASHSAQEKTEIWLSDHAPEKAEKRAAALHGVLADNRAIVRSCDCVFLGVKPQMLPALLDDIRDELAGNTRPLMVSMAAGVSLASLEKALGEQTPIIRIMPNTPVSIGKGMILYIPNTTVTPQQESAFCELMAEAGELDRIDEALIDAASAVSGCGPAFIYLFMEALADGGVACGLPREKAQRYAAQTTAGAAELLLRSGQHPGALKDAVCSPGGSTIQGVLALENGGLRAAVSTAVEAAYQRTKELGHNK